MKILNKFIWSKKEPSNKNDIWFDGSTWKMYTEEAWQSFTLPVDAADKVAKVIENASEVYQEKLNAGYGIIIEGNTISVDDSNVWEAIETLQQNKVEQIQLNDYVSLDRYVSTSQMLIDNVGELDSNKADKAKTEQELNKKLNKTDVATINGKSIINGGNITIKESVSFTPDWNAGEGEEGHILNRTHYADFVEVDIPENIASSEVEVTIPHIVGVPILVHYRGYVTSKYLKISPDDHELHVFSYGPAFKIRRGYDNNIFISGHNDENHRLYIATHFVELNEIFLPETIARKSEMATINGQPLTEGGDIVIEGGGGSYDDTGIKKDISDLKANDALQDTKLTELSEKVDEKVYAYPVEIYEGSEPKVVELGGEKLYNYLGEISIPSDMEEVEGTLPGDIIPTEYAFQSYEGVLQEGFNMESVDSILNLYIGNDKYGYTSLKIEPSEDPNNLKWFYASGLGMCQEGPGSIGFAYDAKNWTLCYKANSHVPCNIKVYWLYRAQKLDINLIPQEIARKEDISPEVIKGIQNYNNSECTGSFVNYVAENGNVTHGLYVYNRELGSKILIIDNYTDGIPVFFSYVREDETRFYYSSDVADIDVRKTSELLGPYNLSVHPYVLTPHKHVFGISYNKNDDTFDFSRIQITQGHNVFSSLNIRGFKIHYSYWGNDIIIDSPYFLNLNNAPDVYSVFLKNKYIEFKIQSSSETVENTKVVKISLEVTKEIDIPSLEARLAALEAKI